ERKPPLSTLLGKAKSLAGKAAPGELRVPDAVMTEQSGRFRGVPAGGSTTAVTDLAPAGWRAGWEADGVPGGSFVGRRSELRYAEEGLNELAKKGARYLVLGEPGAGKSALLARWREIAESKNARVGFGSCRPELPRLPFGGFREAVADLVDLPLRYTAEQAATAVSGRFAELGLAPDSPRAAAIVSFLVGYSDATLGRLSSEVRTRLLRAAIREWFAAEGEHRPVAIMIDDAQHADPVQRALLPKLVIACKPLPVLWVLAGRRGDNQPVLPEVRRIRLGSMTPTDLRETLRRGLGGRTPDSALLKWCSRVGGLPGVAVDRLREAAAGGEPTPELIVPEPPAPVVDAGAIETDDLEAAADALLAQADAAPAPAPAAVPDPQPPNPITARVAALEDDARQVLDAAAVLGPRATHEELSAVLGRDAGRGLPALLAAGLLVERALAPTPTYEFASHYLWEAAAADIDAERAQRAHRAVFKLLAKRAEGGAGHLEALVAHGRAAGESGQIDAQVVAGVTAAHEHHLEAAEAHLREALAQLGEGAKQRPIVRYHLADVLGRRGALDEALEHLSRALDELPQTRAKAVRRVVSKRR
ncbi:MAG: AAA family ATPase, partial [Planctomycetota bacterium]